MRTTQREPSAELPVLLAQITKAISGEMDLDRLLSQIVSAARAVTGAQYAALGVIGPEGVSLIRFIHAGMEDAIAAEIGHIPTGGGLLGELIRHPEPLVVPNLEEHPSFQGFPPNHPPMRSFLGVPVRADGRVFGNLYLTDAEGGFDEEDLRDVTILAAQAGMSIHAAELSDTLRAIAVNEERERISRDLHDGVIQSLFSVGLGLEGAKALVGRDDERLLERMDAAVGQLDGTIREIRSTIFTLQPGGGDTGLQRGLLGLAREYEVNEIMRPAINMSQSLDAQIPEAIVPDVLHIIREAMSNVARHAGSPEVNVDAEVHDARLVVQVRDRGTGFDPEGVTPGNGLGNMAERAVLLGARLKVDAAPGRGTTVTLSVPLEEE